MVDATDYVGNNVTLQIVRESPTKKLVIISSGAAKVMPDGKTKLNFLIEIDSKSRNYLPNMTTLKLLIDKYGKMTDAWVGKTLILETGIVHGKEAVIGKPQ